MAKCKICKTNIPDGIDYCDNCQDKKDNVSNESYLDSLLNSVKNTTPSVENVYKKKSRANSSDENPGNQQIVQDNLSKKSDIDELHSPEIVSDHVIEDDWQDYVSYSIDLSDIEDFDKYNLEDDLSDIEPEDLVTDEELFGQNISELMKGFDEANEVISEQREIDHTVEAELLQAATESVLMQEKIAYEKPAESFYDSSALSERIQEEDLKEQSIPIPSEFGDKQLLEDMPDYDVKQLLEDMPEYEAKQLLEDIPEYDAKQPLEDMPEYDAKQLLEDIPEYDAKQPLEDISEYEAKQPLEDIPEYDAKQFLEEIPELEDEDFDPDLNDLLDSFNTIPDDYHPNVEAQPEASNQENTIEDSANFDSSEDFEQMGTDEDEFLSLLSQMSSDDPVSEDVKAINDLLQGKSEELTKSDSMPSNVGEVFSDALRGISTLTDLEANEEALLNQIPDKKGKKARKAKNDKKSKEKNGADGEKPKKGILQFLFGNVNKEKKKADNSDVESEATVSEPPQKGKVKKSKGKADSGAEEPGGTKKAKKGKKSAAVEGEEGGKEKAAKKEKKPKKEKKNKSKEVIQVIDDIEEDEGRINRLGATIVFLFFGLLVTLILVGTNTISYTLSIEKATDYFDNREYTDAYNEVYGMEIKDEDFAIYNKIMTVMYVNKQLNSYNNYYSIGQYPQALDSLLKGLRRYDKYIELATMLGIENDLKYVRKQILAELKNEFNLSQKQAMKIISYDNMETYSLAVYDVVDKNISN